MKKFISGLFHSKATLAGLLVLVGVAGVAALANAWGPNRRTFTIERPADYITFNSITNSPFGDERNFVRIKEASQPDSAYTNEIKLQPGKEYVVYTHFHNNAAANLNLVAENTKLKVTIPNELKTGQKDRIDSTISASNAKPTAVYDEAFISTDSDVALRYVPGSAVMNTLKVSNVQLPFEEMIGGGTLIGTYGRDGRVPGCNEFSGYVLYRFQVVQPSFIIKKEVRRVGEKAWAENLNVQAGDTLEYRVTYHNNGTITQNNVHLRDALPKGLTYVDGSAEFKNARTNGYARLTPEADAYFKKTGWFKAGNYNPNANVYLRYKLKVEDASQMNCGYNSYTNIASAVTENGTKQARAKVTAHKQCVKDITVCELKTKKIITIKENQFNSNLHSKNLDDCKVKPQPKDITVCELKTKKIITIKENQFNSNLHSKNLDDCKVKPQPKDITVCELKTKKIITIKENQFNSNLHSKNLDDCKTTPVTPEPSKPTELPSTGLGLEGWMNVIGLASLVGSLGYYINSRRLV